jgi:YhcH/YjgK/YiaL family protein
MIVDRLENWSTYRLGEAWETTFEFLLALAPDARTGEHRLQGDDIFARIMDYETRAAAETNLETHQRYVDVQTVLSGAERLDWFPRHGLVPSVPYDAATDATFYHHPRSAPAAVALHPGTFVALFPEDGHRPSLTMGDAAERVRKVVVKIRAELLAGR